MRIAAIAAFLAAIYQLTVTLPGPGPIQVLSVATPGFVSETSKNSTLTNALGTNPSGQTACSAYSYCLPYPEPALAGNIGIISGHFANSTTLTPTATDDKSDTYSCTTGGSKDSGTSEWPFVCYSANLTSGARKITITFGTTAVTQVTAKASTFDNIATSSPLDGSIGSCAGTSSTTANCASVTTTASNDLIYTLVCRAGTPAVTSFTAGTGFSISTADIHDGCASQWEVASSAGSVTPSMTMTSASTYIEIVAAFKSATAGTAPTGSHIQRLMSWSTPSAQSGTSWAFQFPSSGSTLVNTISCGGTAGGVLLPVSISDTGNTWTPQGAPNSPPSSSAAIQEYVATNAAADSSGAITETTSGTGDCTFTFYDIAGLSGAYVNRAVYVGDYTTADGTVPINTTYSSGITSGITINAGGLESGTATAVNSPTGGITDNGSYGGMSVSGPEPIDENNPWSHYYSASSSNKTWTVGLSGTSVAPGNWWYDIITIGGIGSGFGLAHWANNQATSASSLAVTVPSTTSGNLLTVAIGNYNATARTVSKVCLDGTTCAAGNAFTQFTSAASAGSGQAATDIWYLLNSPSGKTTVTITLSASASNVEATYWEMARGSGSWATDGANHTNNASVSGGVATGASVTTTGALDFCVAAVGVSNLASATVNPGNEFGYYGNLYSNTTDASSSLITSSASAHAPAWPAPSGTFNSSTGCFK